MMKMNICVLYKKFELYVLIQPVYFEVLSNAVFVITHELSEWKCDNYDICIDL